MMMMEQLKEEGNRMEETNSLNEEENLKSRIRNSDGVIVDLEQRVRLIVIPSLFRMVIINSS